MTNAGLIHIFVKKQQYMKHSFILMLFFAIYSATHASPQHLSERRSTLPVVVRTDDNSGAYELKRRDGTIVPGTRYTAIGTEHMCESYSLRPSSPIPVRDSNGKWGLIDVNGNIITPCTYDDISIPAGNIIQVLKGNLTGYLDYSGNLIIPLKYTSISDRHPFNGYIVADVDCGTSPQHIYDTRGNLVKKIPTRSSLPGESRIGSVIIVGDSQSGHSLWDASIGKTIGGPYRSLWLDGNLVHFVKEGKEGILDALTGRIILPAIYDDIDQFGGYRHTHAVTDGTARIIDINGNTLMQLPKGMMVADHRYTGQAVLSGIIVVADSETGLQGGIDTNGNILIPCKYTRINSHNIQAQTPYIVCENGNIIDYYDTKNFNNILSLQHRGEDCAVIGNSKLKNALGGHGKDWRVWSTDTSGSIVLLDNRNQHYAIVSPTGELLLDGIKRLGYQGGDTTIPGIYAVSLDNDPKDAGMSLYDATRKKFVSKAILDDCIVTADGKTAAIYLKENSGMVLFYNSLTGETCYRNVGGQPYYNSGDGIIWIVGKEYDFAVDNEGNELFRFRNDNYCIIKFSEGMARIFDNRTRLYGFIDRTGRIVIPCDMDYADDFHDGLALIVKDGRAGFIDKSGAVVIPCEFDQATCFENGRAVVKKNGAYGEIDLTGREVTPCIYPDKIMPTTATRRLNTIFMPHE